MPDKFRVNLTDGSWEASWPKYFANFLEDCQKEADTYDNVFPDTKYNYEDTVDAIINGRLRPLGGKLITTKTQGCYLRWNKESSHTAFVLKWS